MRVLLPDRLQVELDAANEELRRRLSVALRTAVTDSIRGVLDQFKAFRHLLLYFNTRADWNAILQIIHDTLQVDAIQVVALEGLDDLSYHLLPPDQPIDEDVAGLLLDEKVGELTVPAAKQKKLSDMAGMFYGGPGDTAERASELLRAEMGLSSLGRD